MTADAATELLKSLADPTRLRLAALLRRHGTLCVCELEVVLDLPQYTVSRHLGVLRRAGLLETERNGARVDYYVRPDLDDKRAAILDSVVEILANDDQAGEDLVAARTVRPACCP